MNNELTLHIDLNKYALVENTDWKNMIVNGEAVDIPGSWEVKSFSNLIRWHSTGKAFTSEEMSQTSGKYSVIKMTNIVDGKIGSFLSTYTDSFEESALLNPGDVVVGLSGSIGKLGEVIFSEKPLLLNQRCFALRFKEEFKWLGRLLLGRLVTNMEREAAGGAIVNLSHLNVLSYQTCMPTDAQELSSIASVLSTQESIISDISLLISKHEMRLAWLSDQLLSGNIRVKRNTEVDARDSGIVEEPLRLEQLSFYQNPDDNWKDVELDKGTVRIPVDWAACLASDFLKGLSGTKKHSIDLRFVKKQGKTPVWGQEIGGISGYYDENLATIHASHEDPIILFGDHSCAVKLIVEPFLIGGDGVKLFKSNFGGTKFAFFSLKNLGLTTQGYQRHYSILKERPIKYPIDTFEQAAIASVLSAQEELISDYKKLLEKERERMSWLSDALLSGKYRLKPIEV